MEGRIAKVAKEAALMVRSQPHHAWHPDSSVAFPSSWISCSLPIKSLRHTVALDASVTLVTVQEQPFIKDSSRTVGEVIKSTIAAIGENIQVSAPDLHLLVRACSCLLH